MAAFVSSIRLLFRRLFLDSGEPTSHPPRVRGKRKQTFAHHRPLPLVLELESRRLLASISPVSVDFFTGLRTVTVGGDSASETWTINHDGNGGVQISGPVSGNRSNVQQL